MPTDERAAVRRALRERDRRVLAVGREASWTFCRRIALSFGVRAPDARSSRATEKDARLPKTLFALAH